MNKYFCSTKKTTNCIIDKFYSTVGENNIGAPKMPKKIGDLSNCLFLQYCDFNISLSSVTLSIVAALFALTGDSNKFSITFCLNDRKVHCCYAKKNKKTTQFDRAP